MSMEDVGKLKPHGSADKRGLCISVHVGITVLRASYGVAIVDFAALIEA